jgi:peptidoglycan/xylan/chitin deacetylase (PgdA/CDA1 family)
MPAGAVITPNQVISYHKVDVRNEIGITVVRPNTFRKQIDHLVRKGYQFVTLSELFLDNAPHKIAITFDDGYQNNFLYAYPILKEYGAVATVFIITDYIGKSNRWDANLGGIRFQHLNEAEIHELLVAGWEIGSHGVTHQCLRKVDQTVLNREIGESKTFLEEKFQSKISFFSAPFGKITNPVIKTCERFQYLGCCGFYPMKFLKEKPEKSVIPRLAVYLGESPKTVENKVSNDYNKLKWQVMKQNFINFWNNATITVKALK